MSESDSYVSYSGEEGEEGEEEDTGPKKADEKISFFSELSMQELIFGIGSIGVNGLCLGMMLNIPTLTLHNLMYKCAPKGLLSKETSDQDRIAVTKSIVDHWRQKTSKLSRAKRFKQLHTVFISLREKNIAEALKERFEADEKISLEIFHTFDLGRMGPYVPPAVEVMRGWGEEEGYYEDDGEEDY